MRRGVANIMEKAKKWHLLQINWLLKGVFHSKLSNSRVSRVHTTYVNCSNLCLIIDSIYNIQWRTQSSVKWVWGWCEKIQKKISLSWNSLTNNHCCDDKEKICQAKLDFICNRTIEIKWMRRNSRGVWVYRWGSSDWVDNLFLPNCKA